MSAQPGAVLSPGICLPQPPPPRTPAHPRPLPPLHPEAHDQKYQKSSAEEESPAATCCTKPTLAALPANFGLKMLNKGQLKDTFSDPDPGKASLEFTQLEPVVIPVRLLPLQDSQSLVLGKEHPWNPSEAAPCEPTRSTAT